MFKELTHKKPFRILLIGDTETCWNLVKIFEEVSTKLKIEVAGIIITETKQGATERYFQSKHLSIYSLQDVPPDLEADLIIDMAGTEEVGSLIKKLEIPAVNYMGACLFYEIINELRDKIMLQRMFSYNERMALLAALAHSLSDALRNPLMAIGGFAKSISEDSSLPPKTGGKAKIILREIPKMEDVLKEVSLLGRPPVLRKEIGNIHKIIEQVCKEFSAECQKHNIEIVKDSEPQEIEVWLDVELFKKALTYVFKASINSMPDGGRLSINTQLGWNSLFIIINDTGKGLEPWQVENIQRPLSTWKEDREACLIMVRKIIEDHAGNFAIHSEPNKGMEVQIELPIVLPESPPV